MTRDARLEAAFLKDVIERPDDDAPRLAYADWLMEREGPARRDRGEFIRLQCELDRLADDDPRRPDLERQARALLIAHGARWLAELPAWAREHAFFVRGFVMRVGVTAREFLKGAPALFRRAPITAVDLRAASDDQVLELAAADYLGRLTGLNLNRNMLRDRSLAPLLSSPRLGPLTALDLGSNQFTLDTVRVLASSPRLGGLAELSLSTHRLGPEGAVVLFGSGRMGPLKHLNLGHNGLGAEAGRAIAGCAALSGLTTLSLYGVGNRPGPEGVRALAESPYLARLTKLDPGCDIGDEGARALAESPFWRGLKFLHLNACAIGPEGARALAASPVLDSVEHLNLAVNPIGADGARALAESPHLGQVTWLDVSASGLAAADLDRLRRRFGKALVVR
jgi:uncharacterized protein (TIGR02996 family)